MQDRFFFRFWNKIHKQIESWAGCHLYTAFGNTDLVPMQSTGLKDKKDQLIYEGDILKDKYGALHPVSWNPKGFYETDTFALAGFIKTISEDMEVVGNIYENPELLEDGKCE